MDIFDKVCGVLVEQLNIDKNDITMDSRLREDLGADSLDLVDIVMDFEDIFKTEFSEEDADSFQTVGDVVNYIESQI